MNDAFDRAPLNEAAVDLAWVRFHYHHLPRIDASRDMTLAGLTWRDAQSFLDSTAMPSNSGLLASTS